MEMLCGRMIRNVVLKIGKKMVKTNQNVIGEQCIRNDDGVLAVMNIRN